MLGDPLDRAAFAGGVAALEDGHDPSPGVGDPLLHLHELLLQPEELALVDLPGYLFRCVRSTSFAIGSTLVRRVLARV